MHKKAFKLMSLVFGLVMSMVIFIGFSNSNTVKAHETIHDYTIGGYASINYGSMLINMPDGSKGQDRSQWEKEIVEINDVIGGWYRIEYDSNKDINSFFNFNCKKNGISKNSTLSYYVDKNVMRISAFTVEFEKIKIEDKYYLDCFIPYNLELRYRYKGEDVHYTIDNQCTFTYLNFTTVYKLKDPRTLLSEDKVLKNIKIGCIDDTDRTNYVVENKAKFSLANNWFRFEKPSHVNITTTDIADVTTTLDGNEYEEKLHYVINESGEESLMLGRFNVNYKTVTIKNKDYIEFCLPFSEVNYYNSQESETMHTLKIGVMDSITPIDKSFTKVYYDLNKQLNNYIDKVEPYYPIFAVLGGVLLVSSTFIVISIIRKRKKLKSK